MPPVAPSEPVELQLEQHRVELTGYCYRMLGSGSEAEDAVQETFLRAWRSFEGFEGRAALRSWLYRIATNVCFTMLKASQRRARPMDLTAPGTADAALGPPLPETTWVQPVPDSLVLAPDGDPAEVAVARESVRLAFVAALQHLPPRQRAVLILREVLRWEAAECAALLETSVASVNSALQRARATLAARNLTPTDAPAAPDEGMHRELLTRYMDAIERMDVDLLVSVLHEDATLSMPPYELWLRGAAEIARWWLQPEPAGCKGSRFVPVMANGVPASAQYRPAPDGGYRAFAIQFVDVSEGRLVGLHAFLDTATLFPLFGLPLRLEP
jgi:RNA polymerase sigma-70 factor (ECF subfamily)